MNHRWSMHALLTAFALSFLSSASTAGDPTDHSPTISETGTHLLALQGTALALASETFQNVLIGALAQGSTPPFQCNADPSGAGSSMVNSVSHPTADSTRVAFSFYFDTLCAQKFTAVTVTFVKHTATLSSGPGKVVYYDTNGVAQGTISLQIKFTNDSTTGQINLGGAGSYVPVSGSPPLDLAVNCKHVEYVFYGKAMLCQVAAVQDFPALNTQLGFSATISQKLSVTINFHSVASNLVTAAQGALSVGFTSGNTVGIRGTATPFGTTVVSGQIGAFSVFPPVPTAWSVSDADHQQKFAIHVVNDVDRNSTGSIVDTASSAKLATIAVDRSGTGTIRYAGKPAAAITNWVLSK